MFLLRSAFWLGIAYLVMVPHGGVAEIERQAGAIAGDAVAMGTRALVERVIDAPCRGLECPNGQALLTTALAAARTAPAALLPVAIVQDNAPDIPYPKPRPAWRG
jgi:hypothetical protein